MSSSTTEWTYAEYARLPDDGNRYEVIDGEVCTTPAPGPHHQTVAANLSSNCDPTSDAIASGGFCGTWTSCS